MKTALLTPFDTGNIGTVMQAYATQQLINELGFSNDLIYFHYDAIQNPFLLSNLKKRGLKKYLSSIAGLFLRWPAKKGLWKFINSHLKITEPIKYYDLKKLEKKYDFFIVGSDCVWNGDAFALETAYLLDFIDDPAKKGNFASSFACDSIPLEQQRIFKKYLSQFPTLSVREQRGKELIKELTGKDAKVVLDPTLTENSDFWGNISLESNLNIKNNFIFVAEYAISPPLIRDAVKLSKKTGLPIYCLYPPKGKKIKSKVFYKAAPEDVMYLIKNSSYVLTDSYHMMIFSINFNKEFFAYRTSTNLPAISKYNSILQCLDLQTRLFTTEGKKFNPIDITKFPPLNYNKVNKILEKERANSKNFLRELLNNASLRRHQ